MGPLRYPDFVASHAEDTLTQDVVLAAAQLWGRGLSFALLLEMPDAATSATMCRLPGMRCTRGQRFMVLHNCDVEDVPAVLFHHCN